MKAKLRSDDEKAKVAEKLQVSDNRIEDLKSQRKNLSTTDQVENTSDPIISPTFNEIVTSYTTEFKKADAIPDAVQRIEKHIVVEEVHNQQLQELKAKLRSDEEKAKVVEKLQVSNTRIETLKAQRANLNQGGNVIIENQEIVQQQQIESLGNLQRENEVRSSVLTEELKEKKAVLMASKDPVQQKKLTQEVTKLEDKVREENETAFRKEKMAQIKAEFPTFETIDESSVKSELAQLNLERQELKQQQKATKDPAQLKRIEQQIQSIERSIEELEKFVKEEKQNEPKLTRIVEIEVSDNQKLEGLTKEPSYIAYIQKRNEQTNLENQTNELLARNAVLTKELNEEINKDSETKVTPKQREIIAELVKNQDVIQKNRLLLTQKNTELTASSNASEYEWMVKNNIKPTKATPKITSEQPTFETIPTFAIVKKEAVNNAVPLPVNIKNPKGLVYRVQVGAFRKPVPNEFFREFSPVSGDVLANGLTCYMAGYFNNVNAVSDAKNQIRAIGYADAFVVAYCDGERISFAKARELEQSGQCIPLSDNELRIALEENKILPTVTPTNPEITQVQEVPKPVDLTYNQLPGAVEATAVESLQSLFFTVQVGVVNRPMKPEQLPDLTNLFTSRNEKGLLRYSTGKFNSLDLAKETRKEAVRKGVADAFIVAYYKGKRITIAQANQLIATNGPSIFEEIPTASVATNTVTGPVTYEPTEIEIVELKTPKETIVKYEMNVEPENARAQLSKLNQAGIFTYSATTSKIVSNHFNEKELNAAFLQHVSDMNVLEVKEGKEKALKFELPANSWSGAFADWILHCPYEFKILESTEIVFYPKSKQETEELRKIANELLISIHE